MFKRKNLFEAESPSSSSSLFEKEELPTQRINYSENFYSKQSEDSTPSSTSLSSTIDSSVADTSTSQWETKEETCFTPPDQMSVETPETTLGKGVVFKGTLSFKKLLRIDGSFEGELISDGKVIVGPTGVVKSNLSLKDAIIEGYVEGNITAKERLEIRGEAQVHGNIIAKVLSVDEGATIAGHVHITPQKEDKNKAVEKELASVE